MSRRRNISNYVADFETTTLDDDCRVWASALVPINDIEAVEYDNSLPGFINRISGEDSVIYFHNLKFDGVFIISELFSDSYHWVEKHPKAGEFTSLISRLGQFYQITVRWRNGHVTEFRDSLKLLPMSVAAIAAAFQLTEPKGELDYETYREHGHALTDTEKDYIRRDVQIVAQALAVQAQTGHGKLTIGSESMAEYKELISNKNFIKRYPILDGDTDAEIRQAYRGGWTYVKEDRRGKRQGAGLVFDVNSLYPSVMYDRDLPYGRPEKLVDMPSGLWIGSITFTARLRDGYLPCIQIKKNMFYSDTEYVHVVDEPVTLSMTNVDWQLWNEHYDINVISYNYFYSFHKARGLFVTYIDKWMKIKAENTGGMRAIAKLHLNSLYGKFATNPDITGKYPALDEGVVKLHLCAQEIRDPVYTPVGVFITAWARDVTIRAAQQNYSTFAYADTDSLHLITNHVPDNLDVHPTRLGAWKHESSFTESVYLRAKAYGELLDNGDYSIHIAGLPTRIAETLTLDDLRPGNVFGGKLIPHNVPGGVVLKEVDFTLK